MICLDKLAEKWFGVLTHPKFLISRWFASSENIPNPFGLGYGQEVSFFSMSAHPLIFANIPKPFWFGIFTTRKQAKDREFG